MSGYFVALRFLLAVCVISLAPARSWAQPANPTGRQVTLPSASPTTQYCGSGQAGIAAPCPWPGTSNVLNGAGPPTINFGLNGQFYVDTTNHKLWLKVTNSTYPNGAWVEQGIFNAPTDAAIPFNPAPPSLTSFFVGSNYSGLEDAPSVLPGVAGTNYILPVNSDADYLASRGERVMRLPVLWERLQPTAEAALDATYLGYITAFANYAAADGIGIVVDVHNFGNYNGNAIGSAGAPIAYFSDLWTRLATALAGQPGIIGYDLMNEPVSLGTNLEPAMQAAVTAIRTVDPNTYIFVEGDGYSGASTWTSLSENNTYVISDPSNKIIYSAHSYLDCDSSGTHTNWSYQSTNPSTDPDNQANGGTATNCTASQAVDVNTGVARVTIFVNWCKLHSYMCQIGETGAPNSDPHWLASLNNEIAYLQNQNIGLTYWAAGPDFTTYFMGIEPQPAGLQPGNLVDTVEQSVLEKYNNFATLPYAITGPRTGTSGVASSAFTMSVHGWIPTPVTVTLSDSGAGGIFTPQALTIPSGFNGSATFTYTASGSAVYSISATNTGGWVNPSALGYSTASDILGTIASGSGSTPINILSSHAINTAYISNIITLRRASDNATQSFAVTPSTGDVSASAVAAWSGGAATYLVSETDTAPNVSNSLLPVSTTADQPTWSATALNGHPGFTLNGNRLITNSNISALPAMTIVATVSMPSGAGCGRLLEWEFTNSLLLPGSASGWFQENWGDTPSSVGTLSTTAPHVLVWRWQGTGTGTKTEDLFVDGTNVSSNATSEATTPVNTGSAGIGSQLHMGYFIYYSPCSTNGVVGDVMVFNGALSNSEVAAVTSLEKSYYGLP